jgi:hypothetical protein
MNFCCIFGELNRWPERCKRTLHFSKVETFLNGSGGPDPCGIAQLSLGSVFLFGELAVKRRQADAQQLSGFFFVAAGMR